MPTLPMAELRAASLSRKQSLGVAVQPIVFVKRKKTDMKCDLYFDEIRHFTYALRYYCILDRPKVSHTSKRGRIAG
jgi:hypothetical protein